MSAITLAKALKVKNRLISRLGRVDQDIASFNSVLKEQENKVDVRQQLELRTQLKKALLNLKTAISKANGPIQERIYLLAELKSDINFFSTLSTFDGEQRHGYQNTPVNYVATITKSDVDAKVRDLEREIDKIQDDIDGFNHKTEINVSDSLLSLLSEE